MRMENEMDTCRESPTLMKKEYWSGGTETQVPSLREICRPVVSLDLTTEITSCSAHFLAQSSTPQPSSPAIHRIARNGNGFLGNEFRVGGEEEVLNPTHIAIGPNPPIPITIGGGGPSFVLLMLGQTKEFHSFTFQFSHGLHGNSMVDHLKEPKLLASLHNMGFSLRVQKIYHRNPTKRRRVGFTRFEQREILKNWLRQNHHGYRKNRGKLTTL
nr:Expressed protein [Ipomoea batatas]